MKGKRLGRVRVARTLRMNSSVSPWQKSHLQTVRAASQVMAAMLAPALAAPTSK